MKGIAIGLSNNSKEILKRLKKTEFVKDIYIAGSSKEDGKENKLIQVQKPREILLKNFIGKFFSSESSKIPFSSFLISIVANPAIDCCDIFLDSKKLFKEFAINSLLVFLSHPIPTHNTGGCQVVL